MGKKENKFREELKVDVEGVNYNDPAYIEYKKDRFAKEIRKPIWKNYKEREQ